MIDAADLERADVWRAGSYRFLRDVEAHVPLLMSAPLGIVAPSRAPNPATTPRAGWVISDT